ncbi:helix-turn-helix transcriptional regulator [Micromonospora sp. DH14]|uniref:helix-turn-helix domain-containing protein n=1 Tax=Micromonospora sp. DH14 TaxID=3040120 RepID=UPI002440F092|nr:helix-turn-helix transcriptional regulator [Micromonospora sp. DH14]MDG9673024.1 helix-turn-helix transcriptional regulator [Micromonospora sp. DH14]
METTEARVARNLQQLRKDRKLTVRALSARLGKLGRPILPSGITKIEDNSRRVDVGDLVALALALGVTPDRLLLPVDAAVDQDVPLTPAVAARQFQLWAWARAESPLMAGLVALIDDENDSPAPLQELVDDFRRHSLPPSERLRDNHTAARAARDVLDSTRALLDRLEQPEVFAREDQLRARHAERHPGDTSSVFARAPGLDASQPAALRARLKRLIAEVEALIGEADGER